MNTIPSTILDPHHAQVFVEFTEIVQRAVHQIAKEHGWWSSPEADTLEAIAETTDIVGMNKNALLDIANSINERNDGEIIALMHSELSEALEAHRHGNPPSDHIPEFSGVEEEMADCVIRILDYCEKRKFRLAEAIICKMQFNNGREVRHGGKKF